MSRVTKNISKILVCALVLALVFPLVNLVGGSLATTSGENVKVQDHQLIIQEMDNSGKVENVRVMDWLALKGDGTVDVQRPTGFSKPPKIQNMKGFNAPEVKGDTIVWKGLQANGTVNVSNVISQNTVNKDDLTESTLTEKMPLEVRYTYFLDGKRVKNLKDIAGKSGHFRLECYMKNLSKKKEMVTYTDSTTGERKTELAETYLPLVVSPMDWYFDNEVYSNVKTDPTGIISYLPTDFQVSYSIPLFPPATDVDNTIWMEADVKNFSMKPLSLTCAFIFPKTNQADPIPQFQAGLTQLYGGVELLGAGLGQAVVGLGSSGTSQTLLWGIGQITGGLTQLADPAAGLPFAESMIRTQFIPGAQQLYEGLGSATTPDSLLYGADQISGGLNQMAAGIGTAETPDTLLYGTNAITGGLNQMTAGIGSASTPGTLLGGIGLPTDSATAGQATLFGGLNDIAAGVGSITTPDSLLNGLYQIYEQLPDLVEGFAPVASYGANILPGLPEPLNVFSAFQTMLALMNPAHPYYGLRDMIDGIIINGGMGKEGLLTKLCGYPAEPVVPPSAYQGILMLQAGVGTPTDVFSPTTKTLFAGLNAIKAGVGSVTTEGTLLNGANLLTGGLTQMQAGIGSATTPNTLLYGANAVTGGLTQMQAGLGNVTTNPSLIYGINAIYGGLSQIKGSVSTGSQANPGLLEGLQQLDSGLAEAVVGIGSASNSNSLIGGSTQINSGLEQLKAGLVQATSQGTDVMLAALGDSLKQLDLTVGQLAAIAQRGDKFDTYLGRVENKGSTSDMRFLLQTKPVQNPNENNGWIIALVISLIGAAALVVLGMFAFKRYA